MSNQLNALLGEPVPRKMNYTQSTTIAASTVCDRRKSDWRVKRSGYLYATRRRFRHNRRCSHAFQNLEHYSCRACNLITQGSVTT